MSRRCSCVHFVRACASLHISIFSSHLRFVYVLVITCILTTTTDRPTVRPTEAHKWSTRSRNKKAQHSICAHNTYTHINVVRIVAVDRRRSRGGGLCLLWPCARRNRAYNFQTSVNARALASGSTINRSPMMTTTATTKTTTTEWRWRRQRRSLDHARSTCMERLVRMCVCLQCVCVFLGVCGHDWAVWPCPKRACSVLCCLLSSYMYIYIYICLLAP